MRNARDYKRTIVYYTDSRLEKNLDEAVRKQIKKCADGLPIISVSQKPIDFGTNICVGIKPRCYLNLYQQLLIGLNEVDDDSIVYLCEHDVFYHPSYFDFIPVLKNKIYFNLNRYYSNRNENFFVPAIGQRALSQCVSYKKPLLLHVEEQVQSRLKNIASPCIGPFVNFVSKFPNIDIRHGGNFSDSDRFNSKSEMVWEIPGWGTPRMFRASVGYNVSAINSRVHLHNIFGGGGRENPIEIPKFKRSMLPLLFASMGFKSGAEIGVKRGKFSEEICRAMGNKVELKCIDPYHPGPGTPWDEAERRYVLARTVLKNYNAEVIKKTSLHAADEDVPPESLDFVYIDADHNFDMVMQDIIVWSNRVRHGGIVSGHDYDMDSVKTAVDTYTKMHGYELFITEKGEKYPDSSPSWFFSKESK